MDDNLEINGNDFIYYIKTYHVYQGDFEFDEDGYIKVRIWNAYKGKTIKEDSFKSKVLNTMSSEQIREYILDCLGVFDKRIEEFNKGNIQLG